MASATYVSETPCQYGHGLEKYIVNYTCVKCSALKASSYYNKNKEKISRQRKELYAKNPGPIREKVKQAAHKKYGIPKPTREHAGLCECCGKPPGKKGLAVDHCHVTGKFRGWLCHKCNMALGLLGDNLAGIEKATTYLLRSREF